MLFLVTTALNQSYRILSSTAITFCHRRPLWAQLRSWYLPQTRTLRCTRSGLRRQSGAWCSVIGATLSLYFNVFVLACAGIPQDSPGLHALAPNGSEPPFAIAQGVVLLVFVAIGVAATRQFRTVVTGLS